MSKKIPLYICDGKRNCFNMPCYEECHLTHDINHAVRDEEGDPIIAEYYDDEEVKLEEVEK